MADEDQEVPPKKEGVEREEDKEKVAHLRDRDPLLFCKWIAKYPVLMFGLTLTGHIIFILVTVILYRRGYNILPITFDQLPLDIRDDVDYLRGLAWTGRDNASNNIIDYTTGNAANTSERGSIGDVLELVFNLPGGNVFTQENLKLMKAVEDDFFNNTEYQQKFCYLAGTLNCEKVRSVLRYFDGTYSALDSAFNDPHFENINTVLYKAYTNNSTKTAFQYYLGKDAVITPTAAQSEITRANLMLGMPLAGYANSTDKATEQTQKNQKFMLEEVKTKAENYYFSGVGQMKFIYSSVTLLSLTISTQVYTDIALAIGSLAFIILFVCIQTGSLWVGLLAIFSIVSSFVEANLIYRVILDYRYFGIFHVLAIFIILGIGADDVFVFFDTWKETKHYKYKSLAHRLSDCYRKASIAMLFTSLTTGIAFAVSATSPFLGINSFGVFSAILIFVDYISVIVFFPCVVITYHNWWEKYKCCCCCKEESLTTTNNNISDETTVHLDTDKNPIVQFFAGPYFRFVTHKVASWVILGFFVVLLSVSIYFASRLQINEEQIEFLPKSSNFGQYLSLRSNAFKSTAESASTLTIVWGLKPQDLSQCHKTDAECYGETVWDDDFNLNSDDAQEKLLKFCQDLKALNREETENLAIRRSLVDDVPEVRCFAEEMKTFYLAEGGRSFPAPIYSYPNLTSFTYPLSREEVSILMATNVHIFYVNISQITPGAHFNRYFEVATSFWMYNGFRTSAGSFDIGSQLLTYSDNIGEQKNSYTIEKTFPNTGMVYYYGTNLRYAAISVNTTVEPANYGFPKGLPLRDRWEDYISQKMVDMPTSLKGGFHVLTSTFINVWHWFKVQQTLAYSALTGVGIGIAVALPILVIATQNVITGLLATFTICCVTCSVVAVIPLAGWKLGVLESLNLVLVVGLAVDYVVHLAEGYSRCIYEDRKRRTQSALEEVGISVLSGAITTLGASTFLLGAVIMFFTQFGIFMFSTIGFSVLYALVMFITMMGAFGPEGNVGSLKPMWQWCLGRCSTSKCSNRSKTKVEEISS